MYVYTECVLVDLTSAEGVDAVTHAADLTAIGKDLVSV